MLRESQVASDQPFDCGELALLIEFRAEQRDALIGKIMLRAQYVDQLCAPQAVTRGARAKQRLALWQQLCADEISGLAAAGEVGRECAEIALDLQLDPLPARLGGAYLSGRFPLLGVMEAPLQRHTQANLPDNRSGHCRCGR